MYRILKWEDYPNIAPPNDLESRNTDDNLFSNIKRSHLHNIAARTRLFYLAESPYNGT